MRRTKRANRSWRAFGLALVLLTEIFGAHRAGSAAEAGKIFDPATFGARGDGQTVNTASLQSALDAAGAAGGGTVRIHDGVFLTGMIQLKSGVTLEIAPSATIRAVMDDAAYPYLEPPTDNSQLHNCRRALIYGASLDHVSITGGGTIEGGGENPKWKGKGNPEMNRPMPIFLVQCTDVQIHDVRVEKAAMWSTVLMECDRASIRRVRVHSPDGPTRDGIDLVDCHHAVIEDCEVNSQDDSICLKSGSEKGVLDVKIRNVRILKSSVANGLKLGTGSKGSFRDILFEDIELDNIAQAAMAVESVDGAAIDRVSFRDIQFKNAGSAFYLVLGRRGKASHVGSINGVAFANISGSAKLQWGSAISGSVVDGKVYPIRNLSFQQVHLHLPGGLAERPPAPPEYQGEYPDPRFWGNLPAVGYYFRHIEGLQMSACTDEMEATDARTDIIREDVHN